MNTVAAKLSHLNMDFKDANKFSRGGNGGGYIQDALVNVFCSRIATARRGPEFTSLHQTLQKPSTSSFDLDISDIPKLIMRYSRPLGKLEYVHLSSNESGGNHRA
jgi:hypothetical protein